MMSSRSSIQEATWGTGVPALIGLTGPSFFRNAALHTKRARASIKALRRHQLLQLQIKYLW